MKKSVFALAVLAFLHLGAQESAYQHKVSMVLTSSEPPEYLAQFHVYKIMDGNIDYSSVVTPKLVCSVGQEAEITGEGYTIKAIVYKEGAQTKAKTSIVVQENNQIVYENSQDCDISSLLVGSAAPF